MLYYGGGTSSVQPLLVPSSKLVSSEESSQTQQCTVKQLSADTNLLRDVTAVSVAADTAAVQLQPSSIKLRGTILAQALTAPDVTQVEREANVFQAELSDAMQAYDVIDADVEGADELFGGSLKATERSGGGDDDGDDASLDYYSGLQIDERDLGMVTMVCTRSPGLGIVCTRSPGLDMVCTRSPGLGMLCARSPDLGIVCTPL